MIYDNMQFTCDEERFISIGMSSNGRMLFVSHADDDEQVRIISAREVTRRERQQYEAKVNDF